MPIIINLIVEPDTPSTEIQIKLYVTPTQPHLEKGKFHNVYQN